MLKKDFQDNFGPPHAQTLSSYRILIHEELQSGSQDKSLQISISKTVGGMNFSDTQHDNEFFLGALTELAAVQRGAGNS